MPGTYSTICLTLNVLPFSDDIGDRFLSSLRTTASSGYP